MGRDGNFGDITPTYTCNIMKMAVFLRLKKHYLCRGSKFYLIISFSVLLVEIFKNHLGKVLQLGITFLCAHISQIYAVRRAENRIFT